MAYLPRTVDDELRELCSLAPAVAVDGAKGVGKTGSAERLASTIWQLDDPDQRRLLLADPTALLRAPAGTVLIDEWQRLPLVWDVVRRAVDAGADAGRFLLTGSASPAADAAIHSGAGRIVSLRMRPLGLHERGLEAPTVSLGELLAGSRPAIHGTTRLRVAEYADEIVRSGFPGIAPNDPRLRRRQLDGYISGVVDRELPEVGLRVRRPETLRRWLAAYAAATSSTTSYSRILDATTAGDGAQPAKTTTIAYRDHLTRLWLLDPVPGWSPASTPFTRLSQASKHQLVDPGLAARLLDLSAEALVTPRGAGMIGPLFEALATLTVRVAAQSSEARVSHLRATNGGHEVDLIVEGVDGQIVAVEVKLAGSVTDGDVRHLTWLRNRAGDRVVEAVVITAGEHAYRRRDGVAVIPLALLGP